MNFRTDLAMEYTEQTRHRTEERGECTITRVSDQGHEYITLEVPSISDHIDSGDELLQAVSGELKALLPQEGTVLVVGIGNRNVTPDALGPHAADLILATRHIRGELARVTGLEGLRPTAVVSPGVLGTTGVEVSELLHALTKELKPAAIIAIDALAARSLKRLGCTIQLSDAGIAPGSGIGNARPGLSAETLGIPVIGLGIPTVVDALTMANDLLGTDTQNQEAERMVVTPREIDLMISRGARMLAMAVNVALNPSFTVEEFSMLV